VQDSDISTIKYQYEVIRVISNAANINDHDLE